MFENRKLSRNLLSKDNLESKRDTQETGQYNEKKFWLTHGEEVEVGKNGYTGVPINYLKTD